MSLNINFGDLEKKFQQKNYELESFYSEPDAQKNDPEAAVFPITEQLLDDLEHYENEDFVAAGGESAGERKSKSSARGHACSRLHPLPGLCAAAGQCGDAAAGERSALAEPGWRTSRYGRARLGP